MGRPRPGPVTYHVSIPFPAAASGKLPSQEQVPEPHRKRRLPKLNSLSINRRGARYRESPQRGHALDGASRSHTVHPCSLLNRQYFISAAS